MPLYSDGVVDSLLFWGIGLIILSQVSGTVLVLKQWLHGASVLRALYCEVKCTVDVNCNLIQWFDVNSNVKQGCILSPTLFAMYIDDLVEQLRTRNVETTCGDCIISSLLYVNDIVLLAPDEESLQVQIKVVEEWCKRWHMSLNIYSEDESSSF